MQASCPGVKYSESAFKFGKEKEMCVLTYSTNRHIASSFTSWSYSNGKEMYQKVWSTRKDVVWLVETTLFQINFASIKFRDFRGLGKIAKAKNS